MAALFDVIDPDVEPSKRAEYYRILRAMPLERRLQASFEMIRLQRDVLAAGVRALYPDWSEAEVIDWVARLWISDDLWEKFDRARRARAKE